MVDDKNASTTGAAAPLMTVPPLPPTIQVLQLVQDSQQQLAPVFGITPRLVIDMPVWNCPWPWNPIVPHPMYDEKVHSNVICE